MAVASSSPPALSKSDYQTLASFRYQLRLFLRFSEEEAAKKGLSPRQHQALLAIQGFPDREKITIGELTERLQLRHHSVVGLVNRLVADGLVAREQAAEDRRRVFVTLTIRGLSLLTHLSAVHREELRRTAPAFHQLLRQIEQDSL